MNKENKSMNKKALSSTILVGYECCILGEDMTTSLSIQLYSNTTGATSETGTAYPPGQPLLTLVFRGVLIDQSLVFLRGNL